MRNDGEITASDAQRFRMALLRAKLTRMSVVFEADADEALLERLVRYTERQREARTGKQMPEATANVQTCHDTCYPVNVFENEEE